MITGDKQETAINIAVSCRLIHDPSRLLICNAGSPEEAESRLKELETQLEAAYAPVGGPDDSLPDRGTTQDPQRLLPRIGMQMSCNRLVISYGALPWEALGCAPMTTSENLFAFHGVSGLSQMGILCRRNHHQLVLSHPFYHTLSQAILQQLNHDTKLRLVHMCT